MEHIIFPVANGVVVTNDDKQVVSLIDCNGQKKLKSFRNHNKVIFWHFPFMRGFQYFFCGIFAYFQAILLCFDMCNPPVKVKDINKYYAKKLILVLFVVAFGAVFSALLLGLLPGKLGYVIVDYKGSEFLRNFVILCLKLVLFILFVLSLRCFSPFNELLRFNRASDLAIKNSFYCLDNIKSKVKQDEKTKNSAKNNEKSKKQQKNKISVRKTTKRKAKLLCPNFLNFVIFVFILDFIVVTLCGASFGFWFNIAFHLAIFLASISVSYEILSLLENNKISNYVTFITSFLVFSKPTRTHYEVVSVAITEMNMLQKGREFMEDVNKKSFSVVYTEVKNKLANAGVNDKSEADWLVATVLGKNRSEVKLVPFVTDKQYQDIIKATERRAKGESLDNIFGFTEFFGLRFDVNKKVLTPRMETEILVEQVLKAEKNYKNCKILDVGTGSGAIAVALAKNCDAQITALDISKVALATAEANAKKNDVKIEFLHSNLFENLKRKRKFDIIVSNPPYIASNDIPKLDKNVRECDPLLALDGGEDGLDFYRAIISQAPSRLEKDGLLFFEVGKGQASAVRKLLKENGFEEIKTIKDYNKIERIVCGKRK